MFISAGKAELRDRKGDATLLRRQDGSLYDAVPFPVAEHYANISARRRQQLMRDGTLVQLGQGLHRRITVASLIDYCPPSEDAKQSETKRSRTKLIFWSGPNFHDLMILRGTCMHLKVSEIASRTRFSVDAIYAWLRIGLIHDACVLRAGNSIRIDSDSFDRLLKAGKLYRPRGRKMEERALHSRDVAAALGLSEDQHTIKQERGRYEHMFVGDSGTVSAVHPYGPITVDESK